MYGTPVWQRVHDPTSELILTILSANSADISAEKAFDALSGAGRLPPKAPTSRPRFTGRAGVVSASVGPLRIGRP